MDGSRQALHRLEAGGDRANGPVHRTNLLKVSQRAFTTGIITYDIQATRNNAATVCLGRSVWEGN
jgi:hypothetical protein